MDGYHGRFKTHSLMLGTIIDVQYITDVGNSSSVDIPVDLSTKIPQNTAPQDAYDTTYTVRVDMLGVYPQFFAGCRLISGLFGINNHCEIRHEACSDADGYDASKNLYSIPSVITGAKCIIGLLDGFVERPVILGFLRNPVTTTKKTKEDGLDFDFQFNGFAFQIDKDGQLIITADTPLPKPKQGDAANPIAKPQERPKPDEGKGPLTITISKDHELTILDDAKQQIRLSQVDKKITITNENESIVVDKENKSIAITSSDIISEITKKTAIQSDDSWSLTSKAIELNADNTIKATTKDIKFIADKSATLQGNQIAIGNSSTELLDIIYQLFDALSKVTVATPIGPAAPIAGAPQYPQVLQLLTKLKSITGSI